jgi:hypothetical protein
VEIKQFPLKNKNGRKNKCFAKTLYKGVTRGELAREGRPHSQLRMPTCSGMSTADARGAYKKTKQNQSVSCFLPGFIFGPCFCFCVFGGDPRLPTFSPKLIDLFVLSRFPVVISNRSSKNTTKNRFERFLQNNRLKIQNRISFDFFYHSFGVSLIGELKNTQKNV